MANNSFRDSVNSLGWSRRDPDFPVRTNNSSAETPFLSRLQSLNPFGQGGYVQLPTHNEAPGAPLPAPTRREEEEGFFACKLKLCLYFGHSFSCSLFRYESMMTRDPLSSRLACHTCVAGDECAVPAPGRIPPSTMPCLSTGSTSDRNSAHLSSSL